MVAATLSPGSEAVREREPLARQHFVRRFRAPAAAQERLVQDRLLARGNRDESSGRRLEHVRNVERDIHDDSRESPARRPVSRPGRRRRQAARA